MKIYRAEKMFSLPPHMGKGTVHQLHVTPYAALACWNIHVLHSEAFRSMFHISNSALHIIYSFSNKFFKVHPIPAAPGYLLMAKPDLPIEYHFASGHHATCVEIFLGYPEGAISNSYENCIQQLLGLIKNENANALSLPVLGSTHHTLLALYEYAYTEAKNTAYAESKLLSLLTDMLLIKEQGQHVIRSHDHFSEKMLLADQWLDRFVDGELPPLKVLAEEISLSMSSLNRQFKAFYGKSIYDAYLHKKMKRAKEMLEEPFVTVNEVAYKLGYEKVSNFIAIFKRYYQSSPGKLKKKK